MIKSLMICCGSIALFLAKEVSLQSNKRLVFVYYEKQFITTYHETKEEFETFVGSFEKDLGSYFISSCLNFEEGLCTYRKDEVLSASVNPFRNDKKDDPYIERKRWEFNNELRKVMSQIDAMSVDIYIFAELHYFKENVEGVSSLESFIMPLSKWLILDKGVKQINIYHTHDLTFDSSYDGIGVYQLKKN